jgi:NADPH:quinone reductase-like Zn-dependent oxidoreductase
MAKIVRFHECGGPEVLKIEEAPLQQPGSGEVRLRVQAIGLNRAESMFFHNQYVEEPKLPSRLGYEAAGVVEAVGPDVEKSWLGKQVSTIPAFSMLTTVRWANRQWFLSRRWENIRPTFHRSKVQRYGCST